MRILPLFSGRLISRVRAAVSGLTIFCLVCSASSSLGATSVGLQFDGSNDYVTFGQALGLGAGTFTIETWFKRTGTGVSTSTGTGGVTAIPLVTKGRGEGDGSNLDMNYFLGIRTSDNVLTADFEEGATGASPGLNHPVAGTTPIANNTWCHAAASYDGSTWRLYLNGQLEATLTVGQPPRADSVQHAGSATALTSTGAAAGFFAGALDEVRIWNYARSGQDIADNMYSEILSAAGLLGRWGLNEGSGTIAYDSSGHNINGTLVNGPVWGEGFPLVPIPAVTLVSPADQSIVVNPIVTFTCSASDANALLSSATLYVGVAPQTVEFSGPTQMEDTQLNADTPAVNSGAATSVNVDAAAPHAHAVLKVPGIFGTNPGQVPPGASILSATLEVNVSNYGAQMSLYRLIEDWAESEATWNNRTASASWTQAGADGTGSHAVQALPADCSSTGWRTFDITTFVQEWSDGTPHYGIVLVDGGTDGVDFGSSESGTPPVLRITYGQTLQPIGTVSLSGHSDTATFPSVQLQDSSDYAWNCLVRNELGGEAWAPVNFRFRVDANYPDFPTLVAPSDGATGLTTSPTLEVRVSDPNGEPLDVTFYGRNDMAQAEEFAVIVLPDTQNYSLSYPYIFQAQTDWIVRERVNSNIVFVTHMGDITQNGDANESEWRNATNALYRLEDPLTTSLTYGIPYGLGVGNHDIFVTAPPPSITNISG